MIIIKITTAKAAATNDSNNIQLFYTASSSVSLILVLCNDTVFINSTCVTVVSVVTFIISAIINSRANLIPIKCSINIEI